MMRDESAVLLITSAAGEHFIVPRTVLERGRIPAALVAEVDQILAGDDVSGHGIVESSNFALRAISFGADRLGEGLARLYYDAAYGPNAPV